MIHPIKPSRSSTGRTSANRQCAAGYGMIEVLVSMLVMFLGLLGLIGLQARAQHAQFESYQRSQALILLEDMADRINTNRSAASSYVGDTTGSFDAECATKTTLAQRDLCEWRNLLLGAAEEGANASKVGAMIGARGCIAYDNTVEVLDSGGTAIPGTGIYTITIVWQGATPTAAPPESVTCGKDAYGAENLRRYAASTLRIGALGAT